MTHRRCLLALLLGIGLLLGPAPQAASLAAAPASPGATDPHAKDAHAKDDPIFPRALDLGLWSLVVFLGLLAVLTKLAWKPMLEGLRKREEIIRGAVEEAKIARAEMEQLRAKFKAEMDTAFAKIPAMMEQARRDALQLAEEMRSKAQKEIQDERQRLRREIDTAHDAALKDVMEQMSQLAILISTKAMRRSLSDEDQRRLIDDALNEVQASAPRR